MTSNSTSHVHDYCIDDEKYVSDNIIGGSLFPVKRCKCGLSKFLNEFETPVTSNSDELEQILDTHLNEVYVKAGHRDKLKDAIEAYANKARLETRKRASDLWLQLMIDEVGSAKAFAYKDVVELELSKQHKEI